MPCVRPCDRGRGDPDHGAAACRGRQQGCDRPGIQAALSGSRPGAPVVLLHGLRRRITLGTQHRAAREGLSCLRARSDWLRRIRQAAGELPHRDARGVPGRVSESRRHSEGLVVGNSMGAGVALYMAVHYPEMVDRIVLADGGGYRSSTTAAAAPTPEALRRRQLRTA